VPHAAFGCVETAAGAPASKPLDVAHEAPGVTRRAFGMLQLDYGIGTVTARLDAS